MSNPTMMRTEISLRSNIFAADGFVSTRPFLECHQPPNAADGIEYFCEILI